MYYVILRQFYDKSRALQRLHASVPLAQRVIVRQSGGVTVAAFLNLVCDIALDFLESRPDWLVLVLCTQGSALHQRRSHASHPLPHPVVSLTIQGPYSGQI